MKELKLAVIGIDVSKSVSPEIHNFIAQKSGNSITYEKVSVPEDRFEGEAENIFARFDGFNVTIPYKLSIIPYLKKTIGDAAVFGAVNTVLSRPREGYNTDGMGFSMMLENNGVDTKGKRALLLGAGGAGRSVAKKLVDGGAHVTVFDKFAGSAKRIADEFQGVFATDEIELKKYDIVVNATGVGMHKTEGISPVGEELLSLCDTAVDLIYTPKKSRFLEIAESLGKRIINGEGMLFYQAYFAQCIYFGTEPSAETAKRYFEEYRKENI